MKTTPRRKKEKDPRGSRSSASELATCEFGFYVRILGRPNCFLEFVENCRSCVQVSKGLKILAFKSFSWIIFIIIFELDLMGDQEGWMFQELHIILLVNLKFHLAPHSIYFVHCKVRKEVNDGDLYISLRI